MKPIHSKDLIPVAAQNNGISEEMMENLMRFYYKKIRTELSNLSDTQVRVDGLGEFTIKYWLLDKKIEDCEDIIKYTSMRKSVNPHIIEDTKNRLEKLQFIRGLHQEEEQRKQFIKLHKRAQYEKTKNNLEE